MFTLVHRRGLEHATATVGPTTSSTAIPNYDAGQVQDGTNYIHYGNGIETHYGTKRNGEHVATIRYSKDDAEQLVLGEKGWRRT